MISVFVTADSVSIVLFPPLCSASQLLSGVLSMRVWQGDRRGEGGREREHKHVSIYTNAFYNHKILWVRFINNILYNRAKCI